MPGRCAIEEQQILDGVDLDLLQEFERGLDPAHPQRSRIPAQILGYGEISTVFAIDAAGLTGLAFKRLPLFRTWEEADRYGTVLGEYVRVLTEEIGLNLPAHGRAVVRGAAGRPVFYIIQQRLPGESIGNRVLHHLGQEQVWRLLERVLDEMARVWRFNRRQDRYQVAVDSQISNWSLGVPDGGRCDVEAATLWYMDTSTPLFRVGGVEQLDIELFLRSAPSFLAWILRRLYLQQVVDRYYDPHLVTVDLLANFYKEQRADLIPGAVATACDWMAAGGAGLPVEPVTEAELQAYYREDAQIWTLYLAARKVDRFLRTRLLRRDYPYILPERVER
ncbi:MAG TPA: DUF6206 family protein [Anaerolineae bacterium]|nr:DUF6206 family protein [Anaerolineae bacterium]